MSSRGWWRSRPALTSADHMTPELMISHSDEMSQRPGWASRAARMGLAKASPTIGKLGDPFGFDRVEQGLDVEMT